MRARSGNATYGARNCTVMVVLFLLLLWVHHFADLGGIIWLAAAPTLLILLVIAVLEPRGWFSSRSRIGVRFNLRQVVEWTVLFCVALALSRVLPRPGHAFLWFASPFLIASSILLVLIDKPSYLMTAIALAHAILAVVCLLSAGMTSEAEITFAPMAPVFWSDIHIRVVLLLLGFEDSMTTWGLLAISGTIWWAGVGYLIGFIKSGTKRGRKRVRTICKSF